ncbi:HAD-IC family P-type ATPase [Clostridium sp. DJ247]|uniref:cation-translocating P-type ATPase n=1 Tax=Clostridium sp. DJ247 TaxID=2726188 RepID=UPI00162ACC58|nr:HAD-IC family P-type ATPase [Clostridium sp. DJ247]MBC2579263.1 cation-transporting P-type ATPase [Clostridium sp. DJ247]MBC2579286.1 cation-transporting P-type ATPase [Clostridium sp. DJ247]
MVQWYNSPWIEVVKMLESNVYSGLDERQVVASRDRYGSNIINIPKIGGIVLLTIKQLRELWLIMIIIGAIFFLFFREFSLGLIFLLVVGINCFCTALDEYNKEKDLKELHKLNMGLARVIRGGRILSIPINELVVGDIVIVSKGESVPADLRVVESNDLKVNETSVTGEKFISEKYETKIEDKEIALSDMKNILFKASVVVNGSGTGVVIAIGMNTQISNITRLFLEEKHSINSLNKRVNKLLNIFVLASVICLCFDIGLSISAKDQWQYIAKRSSTYILSVIPFGVIICIYIASLVLNKIMRKKNIIFKDLTTIEKLSFISAICTDKIGALSGNEMKVSKIYSNGMYIGSKDSMLKSGISGDENENLYRIMNIGLLCNDTKFNLGILKNSKDDLMEIALVRFGFENGIDKRKLDMEHQRVINISFDTERRIMTSVNKIDKNYRANIKGAVDSLITRCTHVMKNGIEMEITDEDVEAIKNADLSMSNDCLSVIGFAYRNFNYEPSLKENIESHLVFVGLVGFENTLKEDALDSIKKCKELCIRPIILTEDNKLTAFAIGKKIGTVSGLQEILSGVEIDNMNDEEFQRIGNKVGIFSRITSRNKIKIIKALKSYGYVTALTGMKLTDLPALKTADIGITTSVSSIVKKLSDIFLLDIDFMKLLNMVEDSRKIVSTMKKIIAYIFTCSVSMVIFLTLIYAGRYEVPYIIIETFWINSFIMILSSLALIFQYEEETAYCFNSPININFIKQRLPFVIFNGSFIGLGGFFTFILMYNKGLELAQACAFTIINLGIIIFIYSFSNKLFFKNVKTNLLILLNLMLQIAIILFFYGKVVIYNIKYLKGIGIFILIWFVINLFNKFDKNDY